MKTNPPLKAWLSFAALASLAVYILACGTSFSPDDSKVLYTTINPKSGACAIAVYDRATRTSRTVFEPMKVIADKPDEKALILRPQWTADGRSIVTAFAPSENHGLIITVCPVEGDKAVRALLLPDIGKGFELIQACLPIAGSSVFFGIESNKFVRIDLETGDQLVTNGLPGMQFFPTSRRDAIAYTACVDEKTKKVEIGIMNTATFGRKMLFQVPDVRDNEPPFFALSRDGSLLALPGKDTNGSIICRILKKDAAERRLSVAATNEDFTLGNAVFLPDGGTVCYTYVSRQEPETNRTYGIVEIPVDGGKPRRTPLLRGPKDDQLGFFQMDLSNDGRMAAVASTYICAEKASDSKDCALFLVDLTDPERKITKVPVPVLPRKTTD
jgi:hypothetical protein